MSAEAGKASQVIFAAIQKVELVGGESWWSHNSGSLLIGLAAIVAAGLAAYVAIRNHDQQLAHDREIRDRDATRQAIDDAVRGITDFVLQAVTLSGHVEALEKARSGLSGIDLSDTDARARQKDQIDQATAAARDIVLPVSAATNAVHADTIHLSIRIGKTHPVTAAQIRFRDSLKKWVLIIDEGLARNRTAEELQAESQCQQEIGKARNEFEAACFAWLNEGS